VVRILRAQGLRRRTADKETVNVPISAVEVTAEVRLQEPTVPEVAANHAIALLFFPLQGKIRSSGTPPEGKKLRGGGESPGEEELSLLAKKELVG
jgi:hypothetical protein